MTDKLSVLFVCVHNAGRSQMSQALFDHAAGGRHTSESAGSVADPDGQVHPEVVAVMRELDIDLSGRRPQPLTDALAEEADVIVTMGCGDSCPYIPGKRYVDWDLPDPKSLPLRSFISESCRSIGSLPNSVPRPSAPSTTFRSGAEPRILYHRVLSVALEPPSAPSSRLALMARRRLPSTVPTRRSSSAET